MDNETVERERPARFATSLIVGLAFNADAFLWLLKRYSVTLRLEERVLPSKRFDTT
jgi:hypothetical protein